MSSFQLKRLGLIIEPEPGNPLEVEGVLNPAAHRGRDGELYLFPRLVARGNYSRIGIARVRFDGKGDPCGIERLGIALEPEADYELRPGGGGCEDARVTYVDQLERYVMTYTALGEDGPRIALASSEDLFHWERVGLVWFKPYGNVRFDGVDNKDAVIFPIAVPDPTGRLATAILHRPLFPGTRPEEIEARAEPPIDVERESIWISYCPHAHSPRELCHFQSHHLLASPVAEWERLKIGAGAPPVLTRHGWLVVYHGVCEPAADGRGRHHYAAGVMVLSEEHPRFIRYRSPDPILKPELPQAKFGEKYVIFPTGIDRRDDLGTPDRFDVYYGIGDNQIGVARLDLPEHLPGDAMAHRP